MEGKKAVALLLVFGLISVAFGLGAAVARIKESHVTFTDSKCEYPACNGASDRAIAAFITLSLAESIIVIYTPSCCFKRYPSQSVTNWAFATTCFVLNWITYFIAAVTFITGAVIDARRDEQFVHICRANSFGLYIKASACSFLSVILGIVYSCTIFTVKNNNISLSRVVPANQVEIAMGQPIPPVAP